MDTHTYICGPPRLVPVCGVEMHFSLHEILAYGTVTVAWHVKSLEKPREKRMDGSSAQVLRASAIHSNALQPYTCCKDGFVFA
ncbi:unnamed protein product [Toxocara canis]|uniref:Uncharacterized protein n=1 Tax=Toxocara canis TaxID=6265 RepID=A0A183VFH6_TOXCA|nr:unnamed protein product [Toxocara canis]